MAGTTVFRLPIVAPKPSRFTLTPKLAGFPAFGLGRQFRFTEADMVQGLADDVVGERFVTTKGTAGTDTAVMLNGGGLKLTGKASLVGPLVNILNPFTLIVALTMPTPAAGASLEVASLGDFPTRGLVSWLTATSPVAADKTHSANVWQSDNGAPGAGALSYIQTKTPYVAKYDALEILILAHKGSGVFFIEQRKSGGRNNETAQFSATGWQGPSGDKQGLQRMRVGNYATGFVNTTGAIFEAASFYNRDLTLLDSDVQQWCDGAYALAAKRGRS